MGVGLGVGVGAGPPFDGAGKYFLPGAPPFTLVAPPLLTLRSLRLTRFLAVGFAMGRSPLGGRVGLATATFRGL